MNNQIFTLPRDFTTENEVPSIVFYSAESSTVKNRVILTQNLCCFLLNGVKKVHASDCCVQANGGELLLLPAGNVLMTETLTEQNHYEAILVFLNDENLNLADVELSEGPSVSKISFDKFLENFIQSLKLLREYNNSDLLRLKVRELAIYLRDYYPRHCAALTSKDVSNHAVYKFKQIISENTFKCLSISELSFLCNMSVSSFKRHFVSVYGIAPQQYFFRQRMMEAERMLASGKRVSEIFDAVGYESPAAFSSAFRKQFGCSPKQYFRDSCLPDKVFEPSAKQPIENL